MYEMLSRGGVIEKAKLMAQFSVSEKTVRRDIEDLRTYLVESHQIDANSSIVYDKTKNAYELVRFDRELLTNEEVLALSKILLESRAFRKDELENILDKLLMQAVPDERKFVRDMVKNELFNYVPLRHGKRLLAPIWQLSNLINGREVTAFTYTRQDGKRVDRRVKPVALLFSEFYFYLIAYFADDSKDFPAVFRVDRIESISETGEKFSVPYYKRFSDGEFRKRVQFMYPGELQKVTFQFKGDSIEAVLDRLPTAEIVNESDDGTYTVTAEVYGKGVDMWLKSQGDFVSGINISSRSRQN
jgi:predicted DNA-binding transcriptional regulator YafY